MITLIDGHHFKLKLEPIVSLNDGSNHGFEMLSTPIVRDIETEEFFKKLSDKELTCLFVRQLEFFQKLNEQDNEIFNTIFINLSLSMVGEWISWKDFIPFATQFSINVEVDACDVIANLNLSTVKHLAALKSLGIKLWLDDVDDNYHLLPCSIGELFSGIKLDKDFVWSLANSNRLSEINRIVSQWGGENVIAEGIEQKSLLNALRYNYVGFGQGFFWSCVFPMVDSNSGYERISQ